MTPPLDSVTLRWLWVAGTVVMVPHALVLPPWTLVVFLAAGGWAYLMGRYRAYRPGFVLRSVLAVAVIAGVYGRYGTVLGRDPGLALLVGLLGMKFLELRNRRDASLLLFLYYLVLLGSFLYEQSLWLGAYALLATVINSAALIQLNQPGCLNPARQLKLAGTIVLKALPLMLVMYLLFPRVHGALWGVPVDAYAGLTGLPEVMRPGSIHHLSQSSDTAFRVYFDNAAPKASALYWRARVLWETDGSAWRSGRVRALGPQSFTPQDTAVDYRVILEPSNKPWLVALDLPATVPEGARAASGYALERPAPIRERHEYRMRSFLRYHTGALVRAERVHALQLRGVGGRVRDLAERWRRQAREPAEVVHAALRHFRSEQFVYTLRPLLLGADPVEEFLFETRRGFCEHYASAFVTLMRVAGIPSRVVVGYQGGEFNATGGYFIVRQSDAHAWAEVWLPARGWVRVDPTAAVAPERVELGIDAVRRLTSRGVALGNLPANELIHALALRDWLTSAWLRTRHYGDYLNILWYRYITDYTPRRQQHVLSKLGLEGFSWTTILLLAAAVVAALLLAYGVFLLRPARREDLVQRLYRRFCRKLARVGMARAPHEGALLFSERVLRARPELRTTIELVTRRYVRLRYGRAVVSADELRRLQRDIAAVRL